MSNKAWGGRFQKELDAIAARFSASVDVDGRLWPQDIGGSIAHVRMLADQKILSRQDADKIVGGLETIRASIERGEFDWDESKEDVHMNIEAALTRIDDGDYGLCRDCEEPIHPKRLESDPTALRCIECASKREDL